MGQGYSLNALPAGPSAIEIPELYDLTFEKSLGGARFLRTIRACHQHGVVVVKVCQKPSSNVSFKTYGRALKEEMQMLRDVPNVLPYQRIRETATVGLLVRQFIHNSLYDRVSIRPFLENIEKKWITYQLLCAVRDCHARGVFHGDIKSENVLVTSWGWVFLTDFAASFKPVYLPEDNPAEFSFYYDTSARRTCYLAPERFLPAGEKAAEPAAVQWNMDVFSVGCVIAELFTETPTFTLSQLFKYRRGEYDPTLSLLNKIDDEHVRTLISSMIRIDPEERWHAQDYLDEYKGKAFPLYFYQHFHALMQEITDPSSGRKPVIASDVNTGESDDRIDRIYNDFETLSISLNYGENRPEDFHALPRIERGLFPLEIDLPNNRHTADSTLVKGSDNGTFILLNVITASIRSTARASSRIRACELSLAFAERLPDEAKLDRILPYIMLLMAEDANDMVLITALRTMTQLLALVTVITPVNSALFTQYIFPRLQSFVASKGFKQNPVVRATYASCLASLAETASRFLDMIQALQANGSSSAADKALEEVFDSDVASHDTYDATRSEILEQFEGQTKVFLTDNDNAVRRAFLSSVSSLCVFFGESRASDVILSHLNTYLNDPDWLLKCAFFKTIVGVSVYVGGASLEEFILPLILQALTDPQEFVIEQALRSLASIAEMGLVQRQTTWELIDVVARFQLHPNMWIKEAATHFISAATTYLSLADVRVIIAPLVAPYLKIPISNISESELLDALKKPFPRATLDLALQWVGRVKESAFWKQARDSKDPSSRPTPQILPFVSTGTWGLKSIAKIPKTDEDEQWLGRLRNAGMKAEDEFKLLAFRDYIWRTGQRMKRDDAPASHTLYEQTVSLTRLQITPQTVIFDNDAETYDKHVKDLNSALEEATQDTGAVSEGTSENLESTSTQTKISGPGKLTLPGLHPRSGSGQSLSSSPSSGVGLLSNNSETRKNVATGLLTGGNAHGKALPEVATDDATAAGKVHTSKSNSRRGSNDTKSGQRRRRQDAVAARRAAHNYAGNDPTVLKLLDTVYVDQFPIEAAEFGPLIQPLKRGMIRSNSSHPVPGVWRPEGQVIGVLGEHAARVNRIVVSPDHLFVATASDDGTVKIWDASRFERNVTHRSRATYHLGENVKVTSLCFVESTHTFIATGSDGSVHAAKVDAIDGQNGTSLKVGKTVRNWQIPRGDSVVEYAVWSEHFRGENASTLLLATNIGRILAVDLRDMSLIFDFRNPAQHGTPTCFCVGRRHDWLLVGTSFGVLSLWDLRFQLRLRSWVFPNACPITRLQLHPSRKTARRHRVCVTGGTGAGEISVWDIEKVICHEVYRPWQPGGSQRPNAKSYELQNLDDDRSEGLLNRVAGPAPGEKNAMNSYATARAAPFSSYFALYQPSDDSENQFPFVISGGPDGKVRFWDCERLEGCKIVSGTAPDEHPTYTFSQLGLDTKVLSEQERESGWQADNSNVVSSKVSGNSGSKRTPKSSSESTRSASRYDVIRLSAQNLLDRHLDLITDVALLERPFGIVLSADRSGQVFAYR